MKLFTFIYLVIVLLNPKSSFREHKVLTKIDKQELFTVLKESHQMVFKTSPSEKRLAMAWAQVALENGSGAQVFNYNLGNIGASENEPHFYIAGHRFAANDNALEGGTAYWSHLKKSCKSSLSYFDRGDPQGSALQLRRCGYYRASTKIYTRIMSQPYYQACKQLSCYEGK